MIYVIESGNYFKIGYAKNVKSRMMAYHCHNPEIKLIASFDGDKILEKELHKRLKQHKYKLEWFNKYVNYIDDIIYIVDPSIIKFETYLKPFLIKHLSKVDVIDENGGIVTLKHYANINNITELKAKQILNEKVINKECLVIGGYSNQLNTSREQYILTQSFITDFYKEIRNA